MTENRQKYNVLLIEDDVELANMMVAFLSDEGFIVEWVADGLQGERRILELKPDLVVLDIMLPGIDGLEVCRRVAEKFANPILMLTAKGDDMAEITALNRGAVGFLKKPVRAHVLLAHIKALLRAKETKVKTGTATQQATTSEIHIQGLVIKQQAFEALLDGNKLDLTTSEFELLSHLANLAGEIVSRDQLYKDLRGIEYDGLDRSIDMRISTLREKMDDARPPYKYIKTVRGKGYLLAR